MTTANETKLPIDPADLLELAVHDALAAKAAGIEVSFSPYWLVTKAEAGEVQVCSVCLAGAVMWSLQVPELLASQLREREPEFTIEDWREHTDAVDSCVSAAELTPVDAISAGFSELDSRLLNVLNKFRSGNLYLGLVATFRPEMLRPEQHTRLCELAEEWTQQLGENAVLFLRPPTQDTRRDEEDDDVTDTEYVLSQLPAVIAAYRRIDPALREWYVEFVRKSA